MRWFEKKRNVMSVIDRDSLRVEDTTVAEPIDFITDAAESLSLGFDRWDEEYVRGPGLYFVVLTGVNSGGCADHWVKIPG
ncbi:hypothetical protein [Halodesulfurarchaeum sp.]|uniref:hypothetical protein n=1 Tax=Halodesulfurarchaeum sp. TaxID=1980530 RepID=UPI002FC2CDFE